MAAASPTKVCAEPRCISSGCRIWQSDSLIVLLGRLARHPELITMSWTCGQVHKALGERLQPLRRVALQYVHRMAHKYKLKERNRACPPHHFWRLCARTSQPFLFGSNLSPLSDKEWVYRRTAFLQCRHLFYPNIHNDPHLTLCAWPKRRRFY